MFGNDLELTAGGGTHNLSLIPGSPNEFFVTGSATLAAPWVIQLAPAQTPTKWAYFILHYKANIVLSASTVTIFGVSLSKEQASTESLIVAVYDGSAWSVKVLMDSAELPAAVAGSTSTALTAAGGTITLDPKKDTQYQKLTGSAVLVGSWVVTAGGTPVAGDEFWVQYTSTMTIGVNSITIFGESLSASQALGGDCLVYAKYDGASWTAILIEGKQGKADMWEAGSAGTESCTRINSTTGCDATGDYATAWGYNSLASGDNSTAGGNTAVASGAGSVAWSGATASGDSAYAGPGATASGARSVAFGNLAEASGDDSFALGSSCVASGNASIAIGRTARATADYALAYGYQTTAPYEGSHSRSSGRFSIQGDSQELWMELKVSTTDATPTNLQGQDGTDGITIPTDCSANVMIRLIGVQTNALVGAVGDTFMQNIELCVKNIAGVSTVQTAYATTVVGVHTVTSNVIYKDAHGALATSCSVAVSVAANKIQITPTGALNRTILWKAAVSMDWVGYRNFTV